MTRKLDSSLKCMVSKGRLLGRCRQVCSDAFDLPRNMLSIGILPKNNQIILKILKKLQKKY